MEIEYIKAGGTKYYPIAKGVQMEGYTEGCFKPYCIITKIKKGRFKIEYQERFLRDDIKILIIYPAGIEEIQYTI